MVQLSRLVRRMFPLGSMLFACLLLMSVFASSSAFAATSSQPHYKFKLVNNEANLALKGTDVHGAAVSASSNPCLHFVFWNTPNIYANFAQFHFGVSNNCSSRVTGIAASYTLTQIGCDFLGTGSGSGSFPVPSLNPGQILSTTIGWYSYCVQCSNGQIVGYPLFALDAVLNGVRGFIGSQVVTGGGPRDDLAFLDNNAGNPGPLHC